MTDGRKHVIIEGCDGSGKDTLIRHLMRLTKGEFQVHPRASTSLGGPVANLADWVTKDLAEMPTNYPMLYNRHPLISEPIYAPIRKVNPGLRGKWRTGDWVHTNRVVAAQYCVLVVCQPAFHVLHMNVMNSRDGHMPGVLHNVADIYRAYANIAYPVGWPGLMMRYDYKRQTPGAFLEELRIQLARKVR